MIDGRFQVAAGAQQGDVAIAPDVERVFAACPFLRDRFDTDDLDLPTVVFGAIAQLLTSRTLTDAEEALVFDYFNVLAEHGTPNELIVLGTGAIELFNDDAQSQRLARDKLEGRALAMLEEYRLFWGQPDYDGHGD